MKAHVTLWPDLELDVSETEYNSLKADGLLIEPKAKTDKKSTENKSDADDNKKAEDK